MSIHDALKSAAVDCAAELDLPLGWEGEVFTTPAGPHLKGRIVYDKEEAASLGTNGLTRTVGALLLTGALFAGGDGAESVAVSLARAVGRCFPRGRGIEAAAGELIFGPPTVTTPDLDGARIRVTARLPFYAIHEGASE